MRPYGKVIYAILPFWMPVPSPFPTLKRRKPRSPNTFHNLCLVTICFMGILVLSDPTLLSSAPLSLDSPPLNSAKNAMLQKVFRSAKFSDTERAGAQFLVKHLSSTDLFHVSAKEIAEHVRYSYMARKLMTWGQSIPDDVFLNFVLFHKAAQEPFEAYKPELFSRLAPLVRKAGNMREAALMVNNWCADKVSFRPTGAWDMGPLSLLRRGFGRCEELAIFVVSSLRSVAIPARIAWTPAWRHADGNHAWVEVYLDDGKWHFLDAASLQDDLDRPWFAPILPSVSVVWTASCDGKVCADSIPYAGTFLCNETDRYAQTNIVTVQVKDSSGNEPARAVVRLLVWNGGRLRPVISGITDEAGKVRFKVAKGDYVLEVKGIDHLLAERWKYEGRGGGEKKSPDDAGKNLSVGNIRYGRELFEKFLCTQDGEENIVVKADYDEPDSLHCKLTLPSEPSPSSASASPYSEPKKADEFIGSVKDLISTLRPGMDERLAKHLAEMGHHIFPMLAVMDSIDAGELDVLTELLPLLDPKGLSEVKPEMVIDHVRHGLKIRSERIRGGLRYDDEIFRDYVLNPQFPDEPPFWFSRKLISVVNRNVKVGLPVVLENMLKLARRVNYLQPEFFRSPLDPEDVIVYGISHSRRETLIALGSLLRLSGIATEYDEVDDVLLVHDGKYWRRLNLEARTAGEALLPLPAPGDLLLEIRRMEGSCPASRPLYGIDFGLTKLSGEKRIFVRRPQIIWDDEKCAYRVLLSPGRYEFSMGRRDKGAKTPHVEVFLRRLSIKAGEKMRMTFPEF